MKIERFISGAVVADGGTIACRVELGDGAVADLGLDARISKKKSDRLVFVGAGYPTLPGACLLPRGSREEQVVVAAIQDYLDRNCGFLRREALVEADPSTLNERDCADLMAVTLLRGILEREDGD
jgi:hypothetical protein